MKMKMTREMYMSKSYVEYKHNAEKLDIYVDYDRLTVMCFSGRKSKPDFHFKYTTMQALIGKIDMTISRVIKREEQKKASKIEEKKRKEEAKANIKVGDMFSTSWGYEQTNVEFFQVIDKPTPGTVVVREISAEVVRETSWCSSQITPVKDAFIGEPKKCRINARGGISKADRFGNNAYPTAEGKEHHNSWGY